MSIKLTSRAWETEQKGNDLLVLLALCDFASDEGVAFPSLDTLCKKAKVGKTTLTYILKAYEKIGVISREQRKRENKSDTSTLYKINHLNINLEEYKKAYQEARNYTKKSQCEHPSENHNVNTQTEIVNTQTANCEHLEPSSINHQYINHHKKNIKKDLVDRYYEENELLFEDDIELVEDFIKYRKQIKKPLKTIAPITAYMKTLKELQCLGYVLNDCINEMKEREWQTIKVDYIHKAQQKPKPSKAQQRNEQIDKWFEEMEEATNNNFDYEGEVIQ